MTMIGYCRVSSADQSLDLQLEEMAKAGVEKCFAEKQSGTSTAARTELARCIDYVRDGDTLVVTRLDRLARSMQDLCDIVSQLREKGVEFKCLQQSFDTASSEGRLMLHLLGAFAEFETSLRRERQMEGIAKARAKGVYAKKKTKITRAQVETLKDEGNGATAIARLLGVNKSTVYRTAPDLFDGPPV